MKIYRKVSIKHILFLSTILLVLTMQTSFGEIPKTISYQGILNQADGTTAPDGDYTLTFFIYDVETGGTELWTEEQTVTVSKGVFNAILGSVNPLDLAFDNPYWLGIKVNGGTELAPRIALTASPYSLNAPSNGGDSPWIVSGDDIYYIKGNVGIGTTEPLSMLDVNGCVRMKAFYGKTILSSDLAPEELPLAWYTAQVDGVDGYPSQHGNILGFGNSSNHYSYTFQLFQGSEGDLYYRRAESATSWHPWRKILINSGSGGESVIYDDGSNVGIGTTSPTSKLHVANAGGNLTIARFLDSSTNSGFRFTINDISDSLGYGAPSRHGIKVASNESMAFLTGATDVPRMVIDEDGNVGIGTTSPGGILHLYSKATIPIIEATGNGLNANLQFSAKTSGGVSKVWRIGPNQTLSTADFEIYSATAIATYLTIQNNGNVGIGTTSPGEKLTVAGTIHSTSGGFKFPDGITQTIANTAEWAKLTGIPSGFADGTDNIGIGGSGTANYIPKFTASTTLGNSAIYDKGGNVGIGETSPVVKLDVEGDILSSGVSHLWASAAGGGITSYHNSGYERGTLAVNSVEAGGLYLYDNSGTDMVDITSEISGKNGMISLYDAAGNIRVQLRASDGAIIGDIKSFKMEHPLNSNLEIYYASIEGPEAAAYTRGTAKLVNGEAIVKLPEHFALVVNDKTLTVQVTPLSADSEGLAVVKKSAEEIVVKELRGGRGNYDFDYMVQGVRKGFEDFQVIRDKQPSVRTNVAKPKLPTAKP